MAVADLSRLNKVEGVSVYSDEYESRVVIRLAGDAAGSPKPVFYEKSVQIDIDNAYITPAQKDFDLGDPYLPKAAAYQIDPTTVRVRLFFDDDCRKFSGAWEGSINGDLMILAIKKPGAPEPQSAVAPVAAPVVAEAAPKAVAAPAVEKVVKEASLNPAQAKKVSGAKDLLSFLTKPVHAAEKPSNLKKSGGGFLQYKEPTVPEAPNLRSMAIRMVTALSLVLALVFALAWATKKYMGRINGGFGAGGVVRILATGPIDMKKSVAVVDVAGEVLVLGLSGDNITMLTTIDDEKKAALLRRRSGAPSSFGKESQPSSIGAAPSQRQPSLLGKTLGALRIGKVKTSRSASRALFDKTAGDTFAGALDQAGRPDKTLSREELLRQVTGAIKARNEKLRFA